VIGCHWLIAISLMAPGGDSSDAPEPAYTPHQGFTLRQGDSELRIKLRGQFRYSQPFVADPVSETDFLGDDAHLFEVNRARMKVGASHDALAIAMEYALRAGTLLTLEANYTIAPWLKLRGGQWKVRYSRERVVSSAKQQLVDRSIANRAFTLDRQQGVSIFGGFGSDTDFQYWFSVLMGTGRVASIPIRANPMLLARLQWNAAGGGVPFVSSDTELSQELQLSIAVAAATFQSRYTRYSTAGGGQLTSFGFDDASYRVHQALLESAARWKGLSWQQELHAKLVRNRDTGRETVLFGGYGAIGFFPHAAWDAVPKALEFAVRYASVGELRELRSFTHEGSTALNWFFAGHANKLTAELSLFDVSADRALEVEGWRFRLQWEVAL
jgi:hypothetical protein